MTCRGAQECSQPAHMSLWKILPWRRDSSLSIQQYGGSISPTTAAPHHVNIYIRRRLNPISAQRSGSCMCRSGFVLCPSCCCCVFWVATERNQHGAWRHRENDERSDPRAASGSSCCSVVAAGSSQLRLGLDAHAVPLFGRVLASDDTDVPHQCGQIMRHTMERHTFNNSEVLLRWFKTSGSRWK